ncbi:restriction endonuclease subunit S [Citrobacter sp. FDAARGOS_156]|uniref:restriction endonuclease subunit S n=1 Tax=Citrobacter sp. FDAARGOS_156 TaxID=1702170 RepID=UPI001902991F|nr:restriction endonuclease subunit S [Citrobacter sp. FDAARGOS_156]MBJ8741337.1 restriction endonuclease subunit S [Citrobacter sp. FDAARGOS_156]MBJ8924981.1 restriction endonuclease subunit S [Citrobacter sp. FDAARGOS_156]
MGSKWTKTKLKDLGKIVTGKTPSSKINEPFSSKGVLFVTPRDMKGQRWIVQTERYLSDEGLKAVKNSFIPKDSIAVSCIGSDMGKTNLIKSDSVTNQQINSIIVDKSKHDPLFIYYSLSLKQEYFKSIASGSATPILNKNDFGECEIYIPSKESQITISSFLDVLDSKVEINNKINQTLEQMSQTLFKSWFVDFDPVIDNALDAGNPIPEALQSRAELRQKVRNNADFKPLPADIRALFPAEFEETELGCIPKGWNIDNVGRLSENIFSGGTPNTSTEEYWNGALNWFSSGETRNAIIIETEKKITEAGVKNSSTRLSVSGDILIASAGQGHTRGQTSLNTIDTYINQSVVCIRPMKSYYSSWLYFNISSRYEEMRAISDSHSIRGSLTTKLIASMKVISPTDNLISLFDTSCSTFIRKMRNNLQLSCELKKLRDTLLPKLISGELSLEDLPNLVAQTEPA